MHPDDIVLLIGFFFKQRAVESDSTRYRYPYFCLEKSGKSQASAVLLPDFLWLVRKNQAINQAIAVLLPDFLRFGLLVGIQIV